MSTKLKRALPYFAVTGLDFYLLPLLIQDTSSAIAILLIAVPMVCFGCSFVYGIKNGLHWFYPVTVAVLFIPSIFLFYNSSAWFYAVVYGIAALFGSGLGAIIYQSKK